MINVPRTSRRRLSYPTSAYIGALEAIKGLITARVPIGAQIAAAVIQSHVLTLGGKLGLKSARDGPYLLLRGFQKLLACVNTLAVFKRYGQLDALLKLLDPL